MSFIEEFIKRYEREIDHYEEAARLVSEICENWLKKSGIKAIVSYRAKDVESLKSKIIYRNNNKREYRSIEDIYADIVDLSGVRIALYFPQAIEEVETYVKSYFECEYTSTFPPSVNMERKKEYKSEKNDLLGERKNHKKFSGYHARHFRVKLKNNDQKIARYSKTQVEIQVASVLMHAWSEVEHDLMYKPLSGKLSNDEELILDQINGLVMSGEIALNLLQKAFIARVEEKGRKFTSQYELSAFLHNVDRGEESQIFEIQLAKADELLLFLKKFDMDRPEALKEIIEESFSEKLDVPLVETIVERILSKSDKNFEHYKNILKNSENRYDIQRLMLDGTEKIIMFITVWSLFYNFLNSLYNVREGKNNSLEIQDIMHYFGAIESDIKISFILNDLYKQILNNPSDSLIYQNYNYIKYIGMIHRILRNIIVNSGEEQLLKIDVLNSLDELVPD